jgi:hypothetical protein
MFISFFSHEIELLGLIPAPNISFFNVGSVLMLYFALVRSELECASDAWNSVTITDSNKLEPDEEHLQPFATIDFFKVWNINTALYAKN